MKEQVKIKVCGMRDRENLQQLILLNPDFIGFIFYAGSSRFVGNDFDPAIPALIPENIGKTGVFVNEEKKYIVEKIKTYHLTHIQLHGSESPSFCNGFKDSGVKVIKSFSMDEQFHPAIPDEYSSSCDYFLFDTKTPGHGGSGIKFDWKLLKDFNLQKPFFLSGGISPGDHIDMEYFGNMPLFALDINSKFEVSPGYKNINQISSFIHKIRNTHDEF